MFSKKREKRINCVLISIKEEMNRILGRIGDVERVNEEVCLCFGGGLDGD